MAFWSKKLFAGVGILHLCISKRNKSDPEKPKKPSKDPDREKPLNPDPKEKRKGIQSPKNHKILSNYLKNRESLYPTTEKKSSAKIQSSEENPVWCKT